MSGVDAIDPRQFRHVLGHLPTGVAIITAHGDGGPIGMAANSVTSVSLEPPLVLFCPARTSTSWPPIREAGRFCINIMAGHHEPVARRFAAKALDRFAGAPVHLLPAGPALSEAIAWIECALDREYDAGDHTIAVARVTAIDTAPEVGDPLVFFRGAYGSFRASGGT